MRATLGTTNYGLACMWVRNFNWRLERMGLSDTLGDCLLTTANDPIECPDGGRRVLAIMGDPTLRIHASAPPSNLTGATNGSGNVVLNWSPSTEPNAAYHVYRAANMDAAFTRLTTTPTVFTSFTETSPPSGQKVYQVRTVNVINSGSGSYTNLSQGIFTTVN